MSHAGYFKLLKLYSDLWVRRHCRVIMSGEENLDGNAGQNRLYLVSHPTTYDLPLLVHISKRNFYVVVAEGPFAHPIVGWLFRNTGFLQLRADTSNAVIREARRLIEENNPLIYSLKGYGVDFGVEVKPRTGGIRIAHLAGADIYPVHLMIEEDKMRFKWYKDRKGGFYPYTIFSDTLYFVTFCKPMRFSEYARDDLKYEDYKELADRVNALFNDSQTRIERELKSNEEYYRHLRKKGGSDKQVYL